MCSPQSTSTNYSGETISLTPVVEKVLDSFTTKWVMDIITENIDPHQFGSAQNSSTVHTLVELIHMWQQAVDSPGKADRALFVDYSKALDCIDPTKLLQKLANIGVPDFQTQWFISF